MDFVPSAAQNKNIRKRKQALAYFQSLTIALQQHDMSFEESDVLFQSIINAYKDFNFESYLGTDSDFIHDKQLEMAVLKIQSNKENTLVDLEKQLRSHYCVLLCCLRITPLKEVETVLTIVMMLSCHLLSERTSDSMCKTSLKAVSTSTQGFCFQLHVWLRDSSRMQNEFSVLTSAG